MKTKKITEFNKAFGYPVPSKPTTQANYELRSKLIQEELSEYIEACKNNDIVEIADAIGDMLYLVLGASVEHGIKIEPIFDEIHESNMSKLDHNGQPIYREDGKVLKSENYFPPNIRKALAYSLTQEPYYKEDKWELICCIPEKLIPIIIEQTALVFDLTMDEMLSLSRKQPLPLARQIAMYLIANKYKHYHLYSSEAKRYIKRDRTSYIHGVKKIKELIELDKEIQGIVKNVKNNVTNLVL